MDRAVLVQSKAEAELFKKMVFWNSTFKLITINASDIELKWVPQYLALREKCPYSKLFWSLYSRILRICPYVVRTQENTDQNNSEYGHFSGSVIKSTLCKYCSVKFESMIQYSNVQFFFRKRRNDT